jgi:hypothetical protein
MTISSDYQSERSGRAVALDDRLTVEEGDRLQALWERYGGHPEFVELGLDYRLLAYRSWLVGHGILGEEIAGGAEAEGASATARDA